MAELNCIKAVLAEKGIMSKWLAKTLQKDPATVQGPFSCHKGQTERFAP